MTAILKSKNHRFNTPPADDSDCWSYAGDDGARNGDGQKKAEAIGQCSVSLKTLSNLSFLS